MVVSNHFQPLSTLNDCDSERRFLTYERNSDKCVKTIVKERMAKEIILIVGDSHTRGMASELQHNLNKNYVVEGLAKPDTDLKVILCSNIKECTKLSKKG
jgi:hypothetical protein